MNDHAAPAPPEGRAALLTQLIQHLSCGDLDAHEVEAIVGVCLEAGANPSEVLAEHYGADAAQVARYDPQGVTAFVIFIELEDYFAISDTVDELHEQIMAAFETPMLPDFPYENDFETLGDYFAWLDGQLSIHHPRYQLIQFGQSYTHDFQVILVYRADVERVLELCQQLGVEADFCG